MKPLQRFLQRIDQSDLVYPPKDFVKWLGFENEIGEVKRAAWRLFRQLRRKVDLTEVREYLKEFRAPRLGDRAVGAVASHFFDSGAFSILSKAKIWSENTGNPVEGYYNTKKFWKFMDCYCQFIHDNSDGIEFYSNLDAIRIPNITWRNQLYMEAKGLHPVPVIHGGAGMDTIQHYLDRNYDYISFGGIVGMKDNQAKLWLDEAFSYICKTKDRTPCIKVHGFGITTFSLMLRYPWYSVDSTTWSKQAGFGGVIVPMKRHGKFVFTEPGIVIPVALDSPHLPKAGKHFCNMNPQMQNLTMEWLAEIGVPLGQSSKDGEIIIHGVCNNYLERRVANLLFFERLEKAMPEYPWPFKSKTMKMGLT